MMNMSLDLNRDGFSSGLRIVEDAWKLCNNPVISLESA